MRSRFCKLSLVMAMAASFFLSTTGCDTGTYNGRFQERLNKSGGGGAFQADDGEEDEAASE